MLGRAAVAMWWDIAPAVRPEWEDWHTHEHMPERLGIPGFLRGSRWVAGSSYFVLYEAKDLRTIASGPYVDRLNNPTPWSKKMMPHHRNMVRSLCRLRASFGGGFGSALATIRFSPAPGGAQELSRWLAADALRSLPERRGLIAAHLLEAQAVPGMHDTAEQRIRGKDASADLVLLILGYDAEAVQAAARADLAPQVLAAHGALPSAAVGAYSSAFVLTRSDVSR